MDTNRAESFSFFFSFPMMRKKRKKLRVGSRTKAWRSLCKRRARVYFPFHIYYETLEFLEMNKIESERFNEEWT